MNPGKRKFFGFRILAIYACCLCANIQGAAFASDVYTQPPSYAPPYFAGTVKRDVLDEALAEVNYVRQLAGIPGDLTLSQDYTAKAQHGAVVMDVNDVMSHYPARPADMPDDFFQLGYEGTSHSNIHHTWKSYNGVKKGNDSLLVTIKRVMDDSEARNIDRLGHRRWLLNPLMKEIGFGISARNGYSAIYVMDASRNAAFNYEYIAWPVAADHPTDYFGPRQAWSVILHRKVYAKCGNSVAVKLTRRSDKKKWNFKAAGSDGYFNIDNSVYEDCVIFRPDGIDAYVNGDTYLVEITGLKKINGKAARIAYTTRFTSEQNRRGAGRSQ
jgi:hypothetical protein